MGHPIYRGREYEEESAKETEKERPEKEEENRISV